MKRFYLLFILLAVVLVPVFAEEETDDYTMPKGDLEMILSNDEDVIHYIDWTQFKAFGHNYGDEFVELETDEDKDNFKWITLGAIKDILSEYVDGSFTNWSAYDVDDWEVVFYAESGEYEVSMNYYWDDLDMGYYLIGIDISEK